MVFTYVLDRQGRHAAKDSTQILFARLLMSLQRYRGGEAPFGAWIRRVAHNNSIDHMRAQRAIPVEQVRDPDLSREDIALERLQAVRLAFATLPEDQRTVLVLSL